MRTETQEEKARKREYNRQWQIRNKDRMTQHHKAWREKNPTWARDYARERTKRKPLQVMLSSAKGSAKSKNLEFSLTPDDFAELPTHCPVLGIELTYGGGRCNSLATIDRIDNSKGYVPDNVVIVSWRANFLKRDATLAELKALADFYSREAA